MFIEARKAKVEEVSPGVSRCILGHDPQLMLVRVDFASGAIGALHAHPHRQVSYVAAGRFEVEIGDSKTTLGAGDSFFVPPDRQHGVVALEAGTLIDVFSPAREEWLR